MDDDKMEVEMINEDDEIETDGGESDNEEDAEVYVPKIKLADGEFQCMFLLFTSFSNNSSTHFQTKNSSATNQPTSCCTEHRPALPHSPSISSRTNSAAENPLHFHSHRCLSLEHNRQLHT